MKALILTAAVLLTSPAIAQQASSPPFAPYTIDQETHNRIMTYLGEQPAKMSIPLIQALGALAQKAVDEEAKAKAKEAKPDVK